ncbi:MAG TPA: ABC transporter substrate-binding protein [Limnochordales bacterium]
MRRGLVWLVALLIGTLAFAGAALAQEPIKIGFFAPLTGPAAADGKSVMQSAQLAVDEINARGGINGRPVQLVAYDDRFDPREAVAIANRLIEQDRVVAAVSGSYSGPTRAVAPIFQAAGIPMISAYGVHPDITAAGPYIFRQSFIGPVQGKAGAEVAVKLLGARNIVALVMDNDFGRSIGDAFKAHAESLGARVHVELFPQGEMEFTPILARVRGMNPDLIYTTGYYMEAAMTVKQARELGIRATILGTEGADSFQFPEVAGEYAEGVYITTNLNRDDTREVARRFMDEYRRRYGHEPDMVGASTYDAFQILFAAIEKAGTDPKAIRDAIAATRDFNGVTGLIAGYTASGEVLKSVQIQVFRDGRYRYFAVIDDLDLITPPQ